MKFTYEAYTEMLVRLIDKGYCFANYKNWNAMERTVILRHDIDQNLEKAVMLSEVEKGLCKSATYFVLLSTNFYNIHSKESRKCIDDIIKNGGNIGLHFDEMQYSIKTEKELKECVFAEVDALSRTIGVKVDTVSMHRPSQRFLSANLEFDGVINSYNEIYFKEMKYLSDSRRCWRENIDEIIEQESYKRLHILTHPFWYRESVESDLKQTLKEAMLNASLEYYDNLNDNFRNLQREIKRSEIERMIYQ